MNKIIQGDCLEKLKDLEKNSIDLICTDPPYGYSFMGKDWDKAVPSVEIWKECLRVLKPGAFCFVMSAPRQDVLSHMIVRLGEAGFKTDFTSLYWTYASGFPKAMNISKMADKRRNTDIEPVRKFLREKLLKLNRINISAVCGVTPRQIDHWIKENESQPQVPSFEQWEKLKSVIDVGERPDMRWISLGEVVGEVKNPISWHSGDKKIRMATTLEAKALDGSYGGFQPKPAVEVIIVCMKPLSEKTYVDQALKNGKGITWLDNCRIPTQPESPGSTPPTKVEGYHGIEKRAEYNETRGRFPANLLVSDDVLNDGIERGSGKMKIGSKRIPRVGRELYGNMEQNHIGLDNFGDSGSYSRYFDLDAWAKTLPFLIVPKAAKSEKNKGLGDDFKEHLNHDADWADMGSKTQPMKNHHPTVKPLKLMSYLITLGSRKGDTILDPFVGSGTTCLAAKNLDRKYIGIEREEEYVKIAEARLKEEINLFTVN